jgi:hypothetical protein
VHVHVSLKGRNKNPEGFARFLSDIRASRDKSRAIRPLEKMTSRAVVSRLRQAKTRKLAAA